jgi:hypothetical protein
MEHDSPRNPNLTNETALRGQRKHDHQHLDRDDQHIKRSAIVASTSLPPWGIPEALDVRPRDCYVVTFRNED